MADEKIPVPVVGAAEAGVWSPSPETRALLAAADGLVRRLHAKAATSLSMATACRLIAQESQAAFPDDPIDAAEPYTGQAKQAAADAAVVRRLVDLIWTEKKPAG